jgi:hypothetical protein
LPRRWAGRSHNCAVVCATVRAGRRIGARPFERGRIATARNRLFGKNRFGRSAAIAALTGLVLSAALGSAGWANAAAARSDGSGSDTCAPFTTFRRANFGNSTKINNRFLPLVPGMQFTLEGRANTGGAPLPHTVIFTVTDMVKVINGVRTRVIWDRDINDGQLSEAELAFFAQDRSGNVWSMGEYPEEYDEDSGKFTGAPNTWIPGVAGAKAGVMMPGKPQLNTPAYLQGLAPKIEFLDCGQVFQTGQQACVPVKCYNNVLVTDETSPLTEAGAHQRKFYAPGVGNVQIAAVDDPEGETLVLIKVIKLGPKGLANARAKVRALEKRAFRVSSVYRHTRAMFRG